MSDDVEPAIEAKPAFLDIQPPTYEASISIPEDTFGESSSSSSNSDDDSEPVTTQPQSYPHPDDPDWVVPPPDEADNEPSGRTRRQRRRRNQGGDDDADIFNFGVEPRRMRCPHCDGNITTEVKKTFAFMKWYFCFLALIACVLMPIVIVILCIIFRPRKVIKHVCPNCRKTLFKSGLIQNSPA